MARGAETKRRGDDGDDGAASASRGDRGLGVFLGAEAELTGCDKLQPFHDMQIHEATKYTIYFLAIESER